MTLKEKIKNFVHVNRFCIAFLIVFFVVFFSLYFSITFLSGEITAKHITTEVGVVSNKFFGNGDNADYYLISLDSNKTYYILDQKDGRAKTLYDKIMVGKKYRFVLKQNEVEEDNFTHILEVQEVE